LRSATAQRPPFALDERDQGRLGARLHDACKRARSRGRATLASLTVSLEVPADPSAVAFASRRAGEPWFCFEQPDRGGRALAALGEAIDLRAQGAARFSELASRWRELSGHGLSDQPDGSHAAGPVAVNRPSIFTRKRSMPSA